MDSISVGIVDESETFASWATAVFQDDQVIAANPTVIDLLANYDVGSNSNRLLAPTPGFILAHGGAPLWGQPDITDSIAATSFLTDSMP
ncbi:MAG: hypothetical protein GY720_10845 [bacterium]|nr:hypothetical protein [bacterium]